MNPQREEPVPSEPRPDFWTSAPEPPRRRLFAEFLRGVGIITFTLCWSVTGIVLWRLGEQGWSLLTFFFPPAVLGTSWGFTPLWGAITLGTVLTWAVGAYLGER